MTKYIPKDVNHDVNVSPEHPLQDFAILVVGLGVFVAGLVGVAIYMSGHLAKNISLDKEVKLFESRNSKRKKAPEKIEKFVEELYRPYIPDESIKLNVTISPSPNINAFASLGGQIILTNGLLKQSATENELAFVICHEIGHHFNRDVIQGVGANLILAIAGTALGLDGVLSNISQSLSVNSFSRQEETRADEFALDCLHKKFGHVAGSDHFFRRLQSESFTPEDILVFEVLSTHPFHEGRIEHLMEYAKSKGYALEGELVRYEHK